MTAPTPDVALVFSPEAWVEDLHRHLTDHGGARIRQVVLDPGLALEDEYGVLVVSQRWPALTRGFVHSLHATGRRILGVFDATEPAGRDHLARLGVDAVIAADAPIDEFIRTVTELAPCGDERSQRDASATAPVATVGAPSQVTVVGGPAGAGSTEVALTVATVSREAGWATVLLDADEVAPAVAMRLGLAVEPNLRTAIEAVEYGLGRLDAAVQRVPGSGLAVLTGMPNPAAWIDVRAGEVHDVLDALVSTHQHVVVDTASRLEHLVVDGRNRHAVSRSMFERADVIVGVTTSSPVGIAAAVQWIADVRQLNRRAALRMVLNRAPADAFRRSELAAELQRSAPDARVGFAPGDRRVEAAAWDGVPVGRGAFFRSMSALAAQLLPLVSTARPSGRRSLPRRVLGGRR